MAIAACSDATMRAVAIQLGAATSDRSANLAATVSMLRSLDPSPDLVVLPELFALPFWCIGLSDQRFFAWAERLDGETITTMRALARELEAHLVVPFFERGSVEGEYYNSAALINDRGELVPGVLPSGSSVVTYRKNAVSFFRWDEAVNDEKFYFRPGPGFPVFRTLIGSLGILICLDRWFPEGWRVLALQGADVVCVPNASAGSVAGMFVPSIRTSAAQNLVFAVAANRAGPETVNGTTTHYYGSSCIVGPTGDVLSETASDEPNRSIAADIDLEEIRMQRTRQTMFRDRRPELYGLITAQTPIAPDAGDGDPVER